MASAAAVKALPADGHHGAFLGLPCLQGKREAGPGGQGGVAAASLSICWGSWQVCAAHLRFRFSQTLCPRGLCPWPPGPDPAAVSGLPVCPPVPGDRAMPLAPQRSLESQRVLENIPGHSCQVCLQPHLGCLPRWGTHCLSHDGDLTTPYRESLA